MIATDITDGSISGLATIMVVGANIKLMKEPRLIVGASGDTVEFRVCWSNYSSASGENFVITDAIPVGTTYVPELLSKSLCRGTGTLVPVDSGAHSSDTGGTMPADGLFSTTSGVPPAGTRWLRWTIQMVGVNTSGCVCYKTKIN
jgi:uncharacterized repeat protein (TIGR01451 family)